jgi:hypothetical protein
LRSDFRSRPLGNAWTSGLIVVAVSDEAVQEGALVAVGGIRGIRVRRLQRLRQAAIVPDDRQSLRNEVGVMRHEPDPVHHLQAARRLVEQIQPAGRVQPLMELERSQAVWT